VGPAKPKFARSDNHIVTSRELTYDEVCVTDPSAPGWASGPHRFETTVPLGAGEKFWAACREDILAWAVKTRSGFRVVGGPSQVVAGQDYELTFRGLAFVREPVRVVTVVNESNRCGFAYGTLPGHPVSGEEAFVVHLDSAGTVYFTHRSMTLPASGWRALAFPVFIAAQRALRHRYLNALTAS
jgi:uncharacterized protein (UPF0548 family)